jgi:hypothetical protein
MKRVNQIKVQEECGCCGEHYAHLEIDGDMITLICDCNEILLLLPPISEISDS